jgi:hypothetical protein
MQERKAKALKTTIYRYGPGKWPFLPECFRTFQRWALVLAMVLLVMVLAMDLTMDLAMDLTMALPMDLGDGPERWSWEMELGDGPNGDGDLNSNDSNYNASTEGEVYGGEKKP